MLVQALCILLACTLAHSSNGRSRCYDEINRPQRCIPEFVNAAFNRRVDATNTCGDPPVQYCVQTGAFGLRKQCGSCNASDPRSAHPPSHLTDYNNNRRMTWWQSETMLQGVQYPNTINLTLNLGKTFEITYIRLKFHSSRPESFAIFKKTREEGDYEPYQFYSASCRDTYQKRTDDIIMRDKEAMPICTDEYSDISPLTGGNVAFSTLEGRPSAYNFENSRELQEWVSASTIKIVLTRLNTFGDEVFGDPNVLKSYFYAISDLSVGGRCKCNGHASSCTQSSGQDIEDRLVCICEHNTDGADCDRCLPFYNDEPWQRATAQDAHECKPCDCSGLSDTCFFDEELYRRTGHGGHCTKCRENTTGPHCETCLDGFYRRPQDRKCVPCQCSETGSITSECDVDGRCTCKPGVVGDKCDRCAPNHFGFSARGCESCNCNVSGSVPYEPMCDANSGRCHCKSNVEDRRCDACKPGFFGLDGQNQFGCLPCFCSGHSSVCSKAEGYTRLDQISNFAQDTSKWTAINMRNEPIVVHYKALEEEIAVSTTDDVIVWFNAPNRYLGDKRSAYNQWLNFTLRVGDMGAGVRQNDIVLEGSGLRISLPLFAQRNPLPTTTRQAYSFRLNEDKEFQWSPQLPAADFQRLLINVTSLRIRGTFTRGGTGFLDNVVMSTAVRGGGGEAASWVEQCECPTGYIGQFCESCRPGYRRDPPLGGSFARCLPCNCNNHSQRCDVETGTCICEHNTAGEHCERCKSGYYGYALAGTANDCKPCPCPDQSACIQLLNADVVCVNCPDGYAGHHCDVCADGYFGDPKGRNGPPRPCIKCSCNDNIDGNAILNCNTTSGACLKCTYNTTGDKCDKCLPGYYGDAMVIPKGNCQPCDCHFNGTRREGNWHQQRRQPHQRRHPVHRGVLLCDSIGQCPCKEFVQGKRCDMCDDGYWNLDSGNGCEPCKCNVEGSFNHSCVIGSGACYCRPGVTGRHCDQCLPLHYGFSNEGCKACLCDPLGSMDPQCDASGQCPCRPHFVGRRCDMCEENMYNKSSGCDSCPECYKLVQQRLKNHREKLGDLESLLSNLNTTPTVIDAPEFEAKLKEVAAAVDKLLNDARKNVGKDGDLFREVEKIRDGLKRLQKQVADIAENLKTIGGLQKRGENNVEVAEETLARAEDALKHAKKLLEEGQAALREAARARDRFGQQSEHMSELARDARRRAEDHEKEADRVVKTANDALNTSRQARDAIRESLMKQQIAIDQLSNIRTRMANAEHLLEDTQRRAAEAQHESNRTYEEALSVYTEANGIKVPPVDTEKLRTDAAQVEEDANRVKEETARLRERQNTLQGQLEKQMNDSQQVLDNTEEAQRRADEMLAEVDAAKEKAKDAVDMGNRLLKDAQDTLKTLQDFDNEVQASKGDAESASARIPEIEAIISQAEQNTAQAKDELAGAESNARAAKDIANDAKKLAEMASKSASEIRAEASSARTRAVGIQDKAVDLSEQVAGLDSQVNSREKQAREDEDLAKDALSKASQAKTSAQEASAMVGQALDKVDEILTRLRGADPVDVKGLNVLEGNLTAAERQLDSLNLEAQIRQYEVARDGQQQVLFNYDLLLAELREQVLNLEAIHANLPLKPSCFRTTPLEQGGKR